MPCIKLRSIIDNVRLKQWDLVLTFGDGEAYATREQSLEDLHRLKLATGPMSDPENVALFGNLFLDPGVKPHEMEPEKLAMIVSAIGAYVGVRERERQQLTMEAVGRAVEDAVREAEKGR